MEITKEQLQELVTACVNDALEAKAAAEAAEKRPTKEEILSIKDTRKRQEAIAANLDLF